jgi:rhodanese-related sulfurtransferase
VKQFGVSATRRSGALKERLVDLEADDQYLLYSKDPQVADRAADLLVSHGFTYVVDAGAFGLLAPAGAELE